MPRRVAVIGSGIAGLSAAYHIAKYGSDVALTVIEKEGRLGGHSWAVDTPYGPVDLGFMVMNQTTYPNLLRWFAELRVPLDWTDMSFGVQNRAVTWSFGSNMWLWARMACSSQFWKFVRSKSKFHADALAYLEKHATDPTPPVVSIRDFCAAHGGYSESFMRGWLVPFCEAVWSAPEVSALDLEAYTILSFLKNHGFLVFTFVPWLTPRGRTRVYVQRVSGLLKAAGATLRTSCEVIAVRRNETTRTVLVTMQEGKSAREEMFDDVVFATPAGWSAGLLHGTDADAHALGLFKCTRNRVVLHTSPQFMPSRREHWSSWNVVEGEDGKVVFSYLVPRLQHQKTDNLFITLNPTQPVKTGLGEVFVDTLMDHPVIDNACVRGQRAVALLQGVGGVWHAGAFLHYGFHEDGFVSGIEVARALLRNPAIPLYPVCAVRFNAMQLVFTGTTYHCRTQPARHSFTYPLRMDYVDVDGDNKFWWGGLLREDHFGDPQVALGDAVRALVAQHTGVFPSGAVDMLANLRDWGYCFNPITLFFCWDGPRRVRVRYMVVEVSNTPWGQRVVHVLTLPESLPPSMPVVIRQPKTLHVSPFNPVPDGAQEWKFTVTAPDHTLQSLALTVETVVGTTTLVHARMSLTRAPQRAWLPGFVRPPTSWLTVWRIHAEAWKLHKAAVPFVSNTSGGLMCVAQPSISHGKVVLVISMLLITLLWCIIRLIL